MLCANQADKFAANTLPRTQRDPIQPREPSVTELILHHYPTSPMAEKARLALGFKGVPWRSVEVPRLPPKPDLMPLTGGYRRVPVLQSGADIYCDTKCIVSELERRANEPSFFPREVAAAAALLGNWADDTLFRQCVHLVVADAFDTMPAEWLEDRTTLMFGADKKSKDLLADIPNVTTQMCAELSWMNRQLEVTPFLMGETPSIADLSVYPLIWALRARWPSGEAQLSGFTALGVWEDRVASIGHGDPQDMTSGEAIEVAHASKPQTPQYGDPNDAQGLAPGMRISISPSGPGEDPLVTGTIRFVDAERIGLDHSEERVGSLCINFPRLGYDVTVVD